MADGRENGLLNGFIEEEIYMDQPKDFLLEKNRKSVISKGPSIASNKLLEAGTRVLMKSYGVFISSRTNMILVYTRRSVKAQPDIAYALRVTNRYQACAGEAHWSAVMTILKYLKRTKDMFLIYDGGELILEGYSDASFQSDDDDAKFQSSFVFKLNSGVAA
ncbi:UNVERIFIED_CONTAM: hypothetical protein Slati_1433900 [Sesamum latifolium]|uniref:Uncharacterized protein n=1 Tax=Sesamum latifolium TaxID=2727402 RepID=A0AAW2X5R1_9LAMI